MPVATSASPWSWPEAVRTLDADRLRAETDALLASAADDGAALKPQADELLAKVRTLKAQAEQGDWSAEADLATALEGSEDVFWKLKTFAVLNGAG